MVNSETLQQKWDEYEHLTSLYSMYLGSMINLGVFSFAIIGGITTYTLNSENTQKIAILFPLLLSLGLTYIYYKSYRPAKELIEAFNTLGDKILNVELKPHAFLLKDGVILFGLLYLLTSIGLLILTTTFFLDLKL